MYLLVFCTKQMKDKAEITENAYYRGWIRTGWKGGMEWDFLEQLFIECCLSNHVKFYRFKLEN